MEETPKFAPDTTFLQDLTNLLGYCFFVREAHTGKLVNVSDNCRHIWERETDIGHSNISENLEHIHPDDRETTLQNFKKVIKTPQHTKLEFRIILPNNQIKWVESVTFPYPANSPKPGHIIFVNRNITQSRSMEIMLNDV